MPVCSVSATATVAASTAVLHYLCMKSALPRWKYTMTMACPSPSPAAMSMPTDVWMDTATAPMSAAVTPP